MAYGYGHAGQLAKTQRAMDRLCALNRVHPIDPATIAQDYLALGNKTEAMAWLEKAYSLHGDLTTLRVNPDPLRGDPRFQNLMRRVGLAQ